MDEYKEALNNLKDDDCHYPGLDCKDCKYRNTDTFGCRITELSAAKIEELISKYEALQKENEVLEKALEIASKELFLFQSKLYSLEKEVCALGMANSIPFDLEAKYKEEWNDYLVTKAKEELESEQNG